MINTIFYFVNDFDTYKQKLDNNEILAKTIVFVEDQKAIYKNGVRYGSMSDADFRNKVTEVMNSDTVIQGLINEIYDDQWIRDWMAQVNQTITSEQNRLSGVITDLDADIQTKVEDMFEDAQWVLDNVVNN
jgi:2-hydroxy-3-keto-5-methylthiopentenyl-1-phosphate phosphatase